MLIDKCRGENQITSDRKKEFKKRVNDAYKQLRKLEVPKVFDSDHANRLMKQYLEQKKPVNREEAFRLLNELQWQWTLNTFKRAKLEQLRKFLDDSFPGDDICDKTQPLQLIVESPYDPGTGVPEDRAYLATYGKTPDYEQVIFDELKKLGLVGATLLDGCKQRLPEIPTI